MMIVRRANFAVLALAILLLVAARAVHAQQPQAVSPSAQRVSSLDELTASLQPSQAASAKVKAQGQAAAVALTPRIAVKENNYVHYLGANRDGVFPVRAAAQAPAIAADPEKMAYAFLKEQGPLFVADSPKTAFVTKSVKHDSGRSYVRVGQTYAGLPVFAGEMIIGLRDGEGVASVLSRAMCETAPLDNGLVTTKPRFTAEDAQNAAVLNLANDYPNADLKASGGELMIYDPQIVDAQGFPELVWKVRVSSLNSLLPNEDLLVSAVRNEVLMHNSLVCSGKYRTTYDTQGTDLPAPHVTTALSQRITYTQFYASYGVPRRWEEEMFWLGIPVGQGGYDWPSPRPKGPGIPEINAAGDEIYPNANLCFENQGYVYDYYFNRFGRISYDNALLTHTILTTSGTYLLQDDLNGGEITASVNMPMANAYWDESVDRMFIGNPFALQVQAGFEVLDVVGHEYTHGVTEYESGLIYNVQSGAINEGFSDSFGKWVEEAYPPDLYNPGLRWRLGEMIGQQLLVTDGGVAGSEYDGTPGVTQLMVVRDMQNPPAFGSADRVRSKFYYKGPLDSGGVHFNCGIVDKLTYLLTDGDSFNGQTVQGLGNGYGDQSAPALYYEAQTHLLPMAANFEDLYFCLLQAGDNFGFSDPLIADIEAACRAVEIATPTLSEAYTIIYKDQNPAIQAQIVDKVGQEMVNEIQISDPSAVGTLKIRKNPGFSYYPYIRGVVSQGSFTKIYSDTNINRIVSGGVINSLTIQNGFARRVEANEIGSVKMTSYARSWSLITGSAPVSAYVLGNFGDTNNTSIYAVDLSTLPNPNPVPMKLNLVGTGVYALVAPREAVSVGTASKKFLFNTTNGQPNEDVSYGAIFEWGVDPYFRFSPAIRTLGGDEFVTVRARQYQNVTEKGGTISWATVLWDGATTPSATLLPGKTQISAQSQTFSLQYNGVPANMLPTTQTSTYYVDYSAWISLGALWSNTQETSVKTDGGYVFIGSLNAQGDISELSARTHRSMILTTLFTTDPATSVTTGARVATEIWDIGGMGYWYYDTGGFLNEANYNAGLALDHRHGNIQKVWGDACLQGNFAAGRELLTDPLSGLLAWNIFGDVKTLATPKVGIHSGVPGIYLLEATRTSVPAVGTTAGSIAILESSISYSGFLTLTTSTLGQDPIFMNGDVWSNHPVHIIGGDSTGMLRHYSVTD